MKALAGGGDGGEILDRVGILEDNECRLKAVKIPISIYVQFWDGRVEGGGR